MTLNGEVRVQDAPFMVSAVMSNVYGRKQGWAFVTTHWDQMDRRFPKQGLRRMCGGITGLCSPELEQDVRGFFASRKIVLAGKHWSSIWSNCGSPLRSANETAATCDNVSSNASSAREGVHSLLPPANGRHPEFRRQRPDAPSSETTPIASSGLLSRLRERRLCSRLNHHGCGSFICHCGASEPSCLPCSLPHAAG
jgi:ERAP1-like protein